MGATRPARPRLRLISNPYARGVGDGLPGELAASLSRSYSVEVVHTRAKGDATSLARAAAAEGHAVVAALGGDGLVNEAASGLAGSDTALACLPAGLTNAFARGLGVLNDARRAAARLATDGAPPTPRRVDLGTANGRLFTFAAGIGLSAMLNRRLADRPTLKTHLGPVSIALATVASIRETYGAAMPRMLVTTGGRSVEAMLLVAQNADPLTFLGPRPIRVCADAGVHTGTLSLTALRPSGPRDLLSLAARALSGNASRVIAHPRVEGLLAVREAEIRSIDGRPLPVEVDGEYLGELESLSLGVAPGVLRVVT